ncbi:hypothetical protein K8I31_02685 [bacterium]|nr:hypothetical protein [bacterium]
MDRGAPVVQLRAFGFVPEHSFHPGYSGSDEEYVFLEGEPCLQQAGRINGLLPFPKLGEIG